MRGTSSRGGIRCVQGGKLAEPEFLFGVHGVWTRCGVMGALPAFRPLGEEEGVVIFPAS
jgi:hypothetical protein